MKTWLTVSVNVILAQVAFAADCDCTHFPIKPQACVQTCRLALLQRASKDDLESELKLDSTTAGAIVQFRADRKFQSLDALESILSQEKVSGIKSSFDELSDNEAGSLAKRYGFSHAKTEGAESVAAVYDPTRPVTVSGTVTKVEWVNPTARFYADIKDGDGKVTKWTFEAGTPNSLMRSGWTRNSLKLGDTVTIDGHLARSSSHAATAESINTADGKVLLAPEAHPTTIAILPPK